MLYDKIGPGEHRCHWCPKVLHWMPTGKALAVGSIIVDHLDGDPRNNDPANLVASCCGCNTGRAKQDAIKPGELFIIRGGKRLRAERRDCERCGASYLHRIAAASPGRYCSKSCSAKVTAARRSNHRAASAMDS